MTLADDITREMESVVRYGRPDDTHRVAELRYIDEER